jgi:hypothetical protein
MAKREWHLPSLVWGRWLACALIVFAQPGCAPEPPGSGDTGGAAGFGGGLSGGSGGAAGSMASGGAGGVCAGKPDNCLPLCEGGDCTCYCPSTGGRGSGGAGTGGVGTGGTGTGGVGPVCDSSCRLESANSPFCPAPAVSMICLPPLRPDLPAVMSGYGCTDAMTDMVRYCCPAQILGQCY